MMLKTSWIKRNAETTRTADGEQMSVDVIRMADGKAYVRVNKDAARNALNSVGRRLLSGGARKA